MELVFIVELAITIIHNTTSLTLTQLESMRGTEIVSNLMCSNKPRSTGLASDSSTMTDITQYTNPTKTNGTWWWETIG
jgi:hypothetical protein